MIHFFYAVKRKSCERYLIFSNTKNETLTTNLAIILLGLCDCSQVYTLKNPIDCTVFRVSPVFIVTAYSIEQP